MLSIVIIKGANYHKSENVMELNLRCQIADVACRCRCGFSNKIYYKRGGVETTPFQCPELTSRTLC